MRSRTLLIAALVLAAVPVMAIESNVTKSFNVQPGGKLEVRTEGGDIVVRTADVSRVDIIVERKTRTSDRREAEKLFSRLDIDIEQHGNTIEVDIDRDDNSWSFFGSNPQLSVRVVATVPRRFDARLSTAGGDLDVADLNGNVNATTSGGDIKLGRIGGVVFASTSGGDIDLAGSRGNTTLRTSGGDIDVADAGGRLEAATSGGDIQVTRATSDVVAKTSGGDIELREVGGSIEARTTGGDVVAALSGTPRGEIKLVSSAGDVRLSLPAASRFDLDADTTGGDLDVDFPVAVESKRRDSVRGKVNGGGPRILLHSSAGDVSVTRK